MGKENEKIKVWIDLVSSDWHEYQNESIWCKVIGDKIIIDNIPLLAYGLSMGDIISCNFDEEGVPYFDTVVEKSGNSTYRVMSFNHFCSEQFTSLLGKITDTGCLYEGNGEFLVAIHVPSKLDVNKVYSILELGLAQGIWDFEEADFNHSLKK